MRSCSNGDQNNTSTAAAATANAKWAQRVLGTSSASAPAAAQTPPPATTENSGTTGINERNVNAAVLTLGVTEMISRSDSTASTTNPSSARPQPLRRAFRRYWPTVPTTA